MLTWYKLIVLVARAGQAQLSRPLSRRFTLPQVDGCHAGLQHKIESVLWARTSRTRVENAGGPRNRLDLVFHTIMSLLRRVLRAGIRVVIIVETVRLGVGDGADY